MHGISYELYLEYELVVVLRYWNLFFYVLEYAFYDILASSNTSS